MCKNRRKFSFGEKIIWALGNFKPIGYWKNRGKSRTMIEVVFNESAGGSLKVAQHYGKGKYRGVSSVFISHSDGRQPTKEEIENAKREFEQKEREAWKKAVPLGGSPADVFCFAFVLSIGDISEDVPGEKRQEVLENLYVQSFPEFEKEHVQEIIDRAKEGLNTISERITRGEPVRIWYSSNPDELCGMHWFMNWLQPFYRDMSPTIYIVRTPEYEEKESGTSLHKGSWGNVSAEEWSQYVSLQKQVTEAYVKMCAMRWKELQQENAMLRAELNGRLVSVAENIYDYYIMKEIDAGETIFNEARLIGKILGKYRLEISDSLIHLRIEKMIADGRLEVVEEAGKDMPAYRRMLKIEI